METLYLLGEVQGERGRHLRDGRMIWVEEAVEEDEV